eukprot:scaffold238079_cov21-Tisochrysis_lutea.AAC.2
MASTCSGCLTWTIQDGGACNCNTQEKRERNQEGDGGLEGKGCQSGCSKRDPSWHWVGPSILSGLLDRACHTDCPCDGELPRVGPMVNA